MRDIAELRLKDFEVSWKPVYGSVQRLPGTDAQRRALCDRIAMVADWWVHRWGLPDPASRADANAARLAERLKGDARIAQLLLYVLGELATRTTPNSFEDAVTSGSWASVVNAAPHLVEQYLENRRGTRGWLTAIEASFDHGDYLWGVADALVDASLSHFPATIGIYELQMFPSLAASMLERIRDGALRPQDRPTWRRWIRPLVEKKHPLLDADKKELVVAVLDAELVHDVLREASSDLVTYWTIEGLLAHAAGIALDDAASAVERLWAGSSDWKQSGWESTSAISALISGAGAAALDRLAVEVGFDASAETPQDANVDPEPLVRSYLEERLHTKLAAPVPAGVLAQTKLWSLLRRLRAYDDWKNLPERRGVLRDLTEHIEHDVSVWARAVPALLARAHDLREIETLLIVFGHRHDVVRRALLGAARTGATVTVRDRAKGVLATIDGFAAPGAALAETLLNFAARLLDGSPIFPHPLALRGSTWTGAAALEALIRDGVDRAALRFAEYFRSHGGIEEEAVTAQLLAELEFEFRSVANRLRQTSAETSPNVAIQRRQVPKAEERKIGCDLALLLRGNARRAIAATWAEFIQVKKPEHAGNGFADRWRITLDSQLHDLLATSTTSCYWLFGAAGEVFVIPAKILLAFARGRDAKSLTMTISYADIRGSVIPLAQFFVDLFIAGWIGTSDDDAVQTAEGLNPRLRPREIFELTISVSEQG